MFTVIINTAQRIANTVVEFVHDVFNRVVSAVKPLVDRILGAVSGGALNATTVAHVAIVGVAITGAVAIFSIGIPTVLAYIAVAMVASWLMSDMVSFLSGYATAEGQLEAITRLSTVLACGLLVWAALLSSPFCGVTILAILTTSTLGKRSRMVKPTAWTTASGEQPP